MTCNRILSVGVVVVAVLAILSPLVMSLMGHTVSEAYIVVISAAIAQLGGMANPGTKPKGDSNATVPSED